jgi:hypothetical protein
MMLRREIIKRRKRKTRAFLSEAIIENDIKRFKFMKY